MLSVISNEFLLISIDFHCFCCYGTLGGWSPLGRVTQDRPKTAQDIPKIAPRSPRLPQDGTRTTPRPSKIKLRKFYRLKKTNSSKRSGGCAPTVGGSRSKLTLRRPLCVVWLRPRPKLTLTCGTLLPCYVLVRAPLPRLARCGWCVCGEPSGGSSASFVIAHGSVGAC